MEKIKLVHLYNSELMSGIALIMSFISAIIVANIIYFQEIYKAFVFFPITVGYGQFIYTTPLIQLVNDGLMTLFFLLIGLELKFHLVCGEFQNRKNLILPSVAAIGGVFIPASIYWFFNFNSPDTLKGWAIPIATDTAFIFGIISFFGGYIPRNLRAFIISFSLIDDAIALLILAIFYTNSSSATAGIASAVLIIILLLLNRFNVTNSFYYLIIGIILWVTMVEAGIHGTLCGVVLALIIPVQTNDKMNPSFHRLENVLRPMVYFILLPLFVFINSGVSLEDFSLSTFKSNLALGIIIGLFIGKQLGIFLFSYAAVRKNLCHLPEGVSWGKFYGIAVLGGIGFTLSLFIGDITFEVDTPNYIMRVSVIVGSLLSAIFGVGILSFYRKR